MIRVKHTTRPIGNKVLLETTNMASEEVTKALLSHMQGSAGATSSPSHEGSLTNIGYSDNDNKSRSANFDDELTAYESDSYRRVKVIVATAAVGMTFDFGASNVGKTCIQGDGAACSLLLEGSRSIA
jgi:hypothetical protein